MLLTPFSQREAPARESLSALEGLSLPDTRWTGGRNEGSCAWRDCRSRTPKISFYFLLLSSPLASLLSFLCPCLVSCFLYYFSLEHSLTVCSLKPKRGIMDLINWSLNAIDTPSQREVWAWVSLTAEDIYLFGTMITGFLLIGAGLALAYRRIKRAEPAVQTPTRLPAGIETIGRGASSQKGLTECSMVKSLEALTTAVNAQTNSSERMLDYIRKESTQNNNSGRKLDYISDQLAAVVRSQNLLCEQHSDKITGSMANNIMEKLEAIKREIERPVSDC